VWTVIDTWRVNESSAEEADDLVGECAVKVGGSWWRCRLKRG
jgi:hypothetical protein